MGDTIRTVEPETYDFTKIVAEALNHYFKWREENPEGKITIYLTEPEDLFQIHAKPFCKVCYEKSQERYELQREIAITDGEPWYGQDKIDYWDKYCPECGGKLIIRPSISISKLLEHIEKI